MSALSWLGRLFDRTTAGREPVRSSNLIYGGRTLAGVSIHSAEDALKNAAVWACVQYLTRAVAQLPWRVMRAAPNGGSVTVDSSPVDWLLHSRPCPDMGAFSWRQTMLGNALLGGNAYAEIEWDNRGAAYALWPLDPCRVVPRRAADGTIEYEVWNTGGYVVIPADSMFHVRGFGNGAIGYSVFEFAAQSIGWSQATEIFGSTFFGEGMNPSGILEVPTGVKLSPEAKDAMQADLDKLYKGPRGKKTFIADAGMKYSKLSTNPNDSQFVETMQHQVEVICRWFGVPPHKVQHLLRATFSNIEHQSIEVVTDSVMPWVKTFEEEADYKLFGLNRQGFFTKMNLRGLLRGDNASRMALYNGMFALGALSTNDILALEDMNPIGEEGDQRFISTNLLPLDPAARQAIQQPAKPAPQTAGDGQVPVAAMRRIDLRGAGFSPGEARDDQGQWTDGGSAHVVTERSAAGNERTVLGVYGNHVAASAAADARRASNVAEGYGSDAVQVHTVTAQGDTPNGRAHVLTAEDQANGLVVHGSYGDAATAKAAQDQMLRQAWDQHGAVKDWEDMSRQDEQILQQEADAWNQQHGTSIDPNHLSSKVPEEQAFKQYFEENFLAPYRAPYPGAHTAAEYLQENGFGHLAVQRHSVKVSMLPTVESTAAYPAAKLNGHAVLAH
jgi:HK97 family phage portal protein